MVRIELTTCCLRNSCSTTELHRRRRGIVAEVEAISNMRVCKEYS